jgi:hypothetical protein
MSKLHIFLVAVGVLLLAQTGLIEYQFWVQNVYNADVGSAEKMEKVVMAVQTAQLVGSSLGSLFGCLGSWLLVLYLKVRRLEKQLGELRQE